MCGIVGWLDRDRDLTTQRAALDAMARTLVPRGPDAGGTWVSPRAALAHRRLIVIDPEGGAQPMSCLLGDREVAVTYNGEIYNFRELRRELEALGHAFRTRSDTEVVLRAYLAWGHGCVERFNGIFAFALWDAAREELFVARDPLGVKPLFYAQRGSATLVASELKALLASGLVAPEVGAEGLAEIFGLGPMRTPGHGVFRGVSELPAGHRAVFGRSGARVEAYWTLRSREHEDGFEDTVLRVRGLLEDAVTRQLVADVPVGVLLSGGLDSSGVAALAAQARRRAGEPMVETYTVDFVGREAHFRANVLHRDLDTPWAKRVAEHTGMQNHVVLLDTPELIARAPDALRARDLPCIGEVETSLLLLFEKIKPHATVLLSGESADEVFGGYPWFYLDEHMPVDGFPWAQAKERAGLLSAEARAAIRPEEYARDRFREALAEVPRLPGESPREARSREIFYLHLTRFLPFMLDRKDRMSMAASVEVRVPFCDHRLVEYVWNVPWSMKFAGDIEKGLLRRALAHVLPHDVLQRRKTGYPFTQNPTYRDAVRAEVARLLDDARSPILPLLDHEAVRRLVAADEEPIPPVGLSGQRMQLEYLIQVNGWLRAYAVSL